MVKDAVAVPMQSVTIRTGDSNFSPEEIEKQKLKVAARDKDDNKAELSNERLEKQAQKEEREKLAKVVFVKNGSKAHMVKVTTGIADDSYMEIKSGIKPGDEVISGSYSAISRKLKEGAKVTTRTTRKSRRVTRVARNSIIGSSPDNHRHREHHERLRDGRRNRSRAARRVVANS